MKISIVNCLLLGPVTETVAKVTDIFNDGYGRNVSQHSASHPAAYGATQLQIGQSAHGNPCPPPTIMGTQASELDLGAMEEGLLVQ